MSLLSRVPFILRVSNAILLAELIEKKFHHKKKIER